ncbi:MAG: hypothetical protein DRQ02_05345 [Candidatus Latescibacterota bacterium]|nr:MAG: hypothetical protein DRQ02_05345 [Candidatus Latescibacterota bacterium]
MALGERDLMSGLHRFRTDAPQWFAFQLERGFDISRPVARESQCIHQQGGRILLPIQMKLVTEGKQLWSFLYSQGACPALIRQEKGVSPMSEGCSQK